VESFLMARDLYLKPNGTLYPCSGKLWFVPLQDKALWTETETKVSLNRERTPSS
jgi:histone-arginine methyltransferase CARM1